jgi:hypothetical protein
VLGWGKLEENYMSQGSGTKSLLKKTKPFVCRDANQCIRSWMGGRDRRILGGPEQFYVLMVVTHLGQQGEGHF